MTRSFVHENQRLLKQNGDPQMHIETYPNNQQEKYEAAKIVMLPTTNMSKKAAKVIVCPEMPKNHYSNLNEVTNA